MKIRIIKGKEGKWYESKVGQVFEIHDTETQGTSEDGHWIKTGDPNSTYTIDYEDCEIVPDDTLTEIDKYWIEQAEILKATFDVDSIPTELPEGVRIIKGEIFLKDKTPHVKGIEGSTILVGVMEKCACGSNKFYRNRESRKSDSCVSYSCFKCGLSYKRTLSIKKTEFEVTGRNEPCPCGSGKKFKNCCLN